MVRHGQTNWNAEKRFQSTSDVPLNEVGLAQARAIRDELARRGVRFGAAWSSPLGRAVESARIILEGSGMQAEIAPELLELSFGDWEARLESELASEYGERFQRWRESHYTMAPPGGEDLTDGAYRLRDFLGRIIAPAVEGDVLVVAHQAIMMALKVAISGRVDVASAFSFKQNNDEVDVWDLGTGQRIEMWHVRDVTAAQ